MAADVLRLPLTEAAKAIVLTHLEAAEVACARLTDPADSEALHDFRVALRRLRSIERAFRQTLDLYFPKKLRKRIQTLAAETGLARDTEVQLAWMTAQRDLIKPYEAAGFDWLYQRLTLRLQEEYAELRETLPQVFPRLADELRTRLAVTMQPGNEPVFCLSLAELLDTTGNDWLTHWLQIHATQDDEQVHAARIASKRLRYLLEPVAEALPRAKVLIEALKGLQDLTGAIHDHQVLAKELIRAAEEAGAAHFRKMVQLSLQASPDSDATQTAKQGDERPGLMALARDLHQMHQDLFGRLLARIDASDHRRLHSHLLAWTQVLRTLAEDPDLTGPDLPTDDGQA